MRNRVLFTASFCSLLALAVGVTYPASAQYSDPASKSGASARQSGGGSQPSDQEGPNKGVDETVIVPRKRPTKLPTPPPQPKPEKINPDEAYAIRTDVELVSVGVVVQDKSGMFIPGLGK